MFVLPFLIGFVLWFVLPMGQSIVYSFSNISFTGDGMILSAAGLENYRYAIFSDASFIRTLISSSATILWQIPIIMFFSMFIAILLNGKFAGRLFFRAAMFLPVIFSVKIFLDQISGGGHAISTMESSREAIAATSDTLKLLWYELMNNFGLPLGVIERLQSYVDNIFDIAWKSGIQIILFIIGLQAIPGYLYEVCKLEGATRWETFWKITFPMLSPTILLCLIYTIIDLFNSSTNRVIAMVELNMTTRLHYACAQTWMYSIIVFVFVFVVYRLVAKRVIYLD